MKKKLVFYLFVLLVSIKVTAQSNEQEAVLTYKLAMEEYDKGNFDKATDLFTKVLKLDSKSEAKVAYMKVKCSENFLFKDIEDENLDSRDADYLDCMANIETYIKKGSDENRKNELLRLKIKIENTKEYKLAKEFEVFTKDDAFKMLCDAQKKFPNNFSNLIESPLRLNDTYLNVFSAVVTPDRVPFYILHVYRVKLKNRIYKSGSNYEFDNSNIEGHKAQYQSENKFRKYIEEDISNYLSYNLKSHGTQHGCNCFSPNGSLTHNSVIDFLGEIYNVNNAGDDYNLRMVYALETLFYLTP